MAEVDPLVDRQRLQTLQPLDRLRPEAFEELATKTRVETCHAGRRLFMRGRRDQWTVYLLAGRLRLDWNDGSSEEISADSLAARTPLANQQPRPATATAVNTVRYIRIDNTLLEILGRDLRRDSYSLQEITEDDPHLSNRLFYRIFRDYMADTLELPHLPEVALKVREAVRDPECDVRKVTRLIQTDPVLAARLVQVANSALYGVQTPIGSCSAAVIFLGLERTRSLVTSFTLRQLFQSDSPLLRERMQALWQHSALVGAVAHVLADLTPGMDPDRALLLGLLHNIGAVPVIHYAGRFPELAGDAEQLEESISALRNQVGAMILRQWRFGEETVGILLDSSSWQRDPADRPDYADLLVVAQYLVAAEPRPSAAEIPAYGKIARGTLEPDLEARLLAEAREEVARTLQLLE